MQLGTEQSHNESFSITFPLEFGLTSGPEKEFDRRLDWNYQSDVTDDIVAREGDVIGKDFG